MRRTLLSTFVLSSALLLACGGEEPAPLPPPPPPVAPPPVASAAPPPAETAAPAPEPTPEEKKKAEALKQLQEERAKWQEQQKAEVSRWTPQMHAAAKALAEKKYPDLKAAMKDVLAGPQRKPGDADRDKYRHPAETLAFFGIRPNMTVLEVGPGEGWYTEVLAPTLAARGKLIATMNDPNGPEDSRGTFYGQRYKAFLETAPEVYGKVQTVVVDGKAPKLDAAGNVDAVLLMREVHGMVNSGTLDAWLAEIHKALKPGGILGIEEHRAKADAEPMESSKKGYVPEKWLIGQIENAGFKLAGKSEINANAKDTKDYPEGVWTLPPSLELKDKDKDKYLAIGESDRMTLKFVKGPEKAAPKAAPAPAPAAAPKPAPKTK
jgi:predicted methyltransferase